MPRPIKCRNVCCLPEYNSFGPFGSENGGDVITKMTVDEYETIRLIDLEGLSQEECSAQMNVARTTVQLIYNNARFKLAESLVKGRMLQIEGGEYKLCEGDARPCGKERCPKCGCRNLKEKILK
ncbi:MAG: DUF134 domain-containing protein [Saccharofermentanales bacterium]